MAKGSETMVIDWSRVQRLIRYVRDLKDGKDGRKLYEEHRSDIETVRPQEAFAIFNELLQQGMREDDVLEFLDKVMNVFHQSLAQYSWESPPGKAFLKELQQENRALEAKLDAIKPLLKDGNPLNRQVLIQVLEEITTYQVHFVKKENILFPYLERAEPYFAGVSIMWALHDKAKRVLRTAIDQAGCPEVDDQNVKLLVSKVFFVLLYLVRKEELILFPSAVEALEPEDWQAMSKQCQEYGVAFDERSRRPGQHWTAGNGSAYAGGAGADGFIQTSTGKLAAADVVRILDVLPVDITLVDADDKVQFFSAGRQRTFPRSPAVIGRDVKQCHPPASVHIVERIVASFRSGEQSQVEFWITLQERFVHIQYFALRDDAGTYKGTLEVTQDATDVRKLSGERRLLQWSETKPETE